MKDKYFLDISEEGLEFIIREVDDSLRLELPITDEQYCNEQREVYHEFELMRLALLSGRAVIDKETKTATLIVKLPVMNKQDVVRWMSLNRETYIDQRTGELDCTRLAEEAADMFNLYEGYDSVVPEWLFEMSAELV